MAPKDQELLKRLLATFQGEAEEHLKAISSALIELEKRAPPERQVGMIEIGFREAHSLKGAARVVNLVKVEGACQSLEGIFARLKAQEMALSKELFDQLHQMVSTLSGLLSEGERDDTRNGETHASQTPYSREITSAPPLIREEKQG